MDFLRPSLARHQLAMDNLNFSCCSSEAVGDFGAEPAASVNIGFAGVTTDSGKDIFIGGKVRTMMTLGPKFDSYLTSLSNRNKAGKALKLWDLVLSKAVHSSWI